MFVVLKSLYICNINVLGIRPTFLLQHILVACLNCWRCLAVWGAGQGECVWYLQVEGWGCCYVESENPCFGTWGKVGITHKNLGHCVVPVAAHKHFPSSPSFQFARKLLCACAGAGHRQAQGDTLSSDELWHLLCPRARHSGHSSTSHPQQR